jgi:hypothetical protein
MFKKHIVISTMVIIVVVAIAAVSYLILTRPREEVTPPPPVGATLEDNIKAALAENKNVAKEKISVHFYSSTENQGILAVGAVIENRSSNLFFYDSGGQKITRMLVDSGAENSEVAIVWSICASKISEWTGNKLVPWGFSRVENVNAYGFLYSDGYIPEWSKWSTGSATIYIDNQEIEWGFFF